MYLFFCLLIILIIILLIDQNKVNETFHNYYRPIHFSSPYPYLNPPNIVLPTKIYKYPYYYPFSWKKYYPQYFYSTYPYMYF